MPSNRRPAASSSSKASDSPSPGEPSPAGSADKGARILKKYPNRRLYDTRTSSYITLVDVKQMVLDCERFEVRDAKTGEDLTRSILLQIILEAETGGMPMFSNEMLSHLIRLYGHAMQGMMGSYLEKNMQTFVELQRQFASQAKGALEPKAFTPENWAQYMGNQAPFMQGLMGNYLEQSKAMFEQMQTQLQAQMPAAGLFSGMPGFGTKR